MDENLPTPVWSGTLRLFGVDLKCHVLDNGQHIIEADSLAALFDAMGSGVVIDQSEMEGFARWQRGLP